MLLTKSQMKKIERDKRNAALNIATAFALDQRDKFDDIAYVVSQNKAPKPALTLQDQIANAYAQRIEVDGIVNDYDRRANEAELAGDHDTAIGLRAIADDAATRGTTQNERHIIQVRSEPIDRETEARSLAGKLAAKSRLDNESPESQVYGRDNDVSWVADVATVQAASPLMVRSIPQAAQRGLYRMQEQGFDLKIQREAQAARERLAIYNQELYRNVMAESPLGQRALRSLRSLYRYQGYTQVPGEVDSRVRRDVQLMREERDAATTISGQMAYFVPPVVFSDAWALYRTNAAPILGIAGQQPLPTHGMQVLIPTLATPVGVASHSEGWGSWLASTAYALGASITRVIGGQEYLFVCTTAGTSGGSEPSWNTTVGAYTSDGAVLRWQCQARPSLTYEGSGSTGAPGWDSSNTSPVLTYSGMVSAPQQLLDRAAMSQGFDQFVAAQCSKEAHSAFGLDVISAIINAPDVQAVTTIGSTLFNGVYFWADFNAAAQALETTAGVAVSPDYLGAKSAVLRGFMSDVDGSGRPLWLGNSGMSLTGNVEGMMGTLPGGMGMYREENLGEFQISGSAIVLVGSASKGLTVFTSDPILNVYPEFAAGALTAAVVCYSYAAACVLYGGAAFCTVSGSDVYGS